MYDYIIVGGGISGLYANWKLKTYSGLLLEREDVFGGRTFEIDFHGTRIKMGAGILEPQNKHLLRLLKKLGITPKPFEDSLESMPPYNHSINTMIAMIKAKYSSLHKRITTMSMKKFLLTYFGLEFTLEYMKQCEYLDWIESDVDYHIRYYSIDDMTIGPYQGYSIQWTDLIKKLTLPNCKTNIEVIQIESKQNYFILHTKDNTYTTKQVIMATSLKPLNQLIRMKTWSYEDKIGAVPFVRIYVWNKTAILKNKLPGYFTVDNELQKIIVVNKNVLMASYSDNANAAYWIHINTLPKEKIIRIVQRKLEQAIPHYVNQIEDVIISTWDEGVHFYKPHRMDFDALLYQLSHPMKGITVIGEIVSKKVGWVEGAVESVDRIIGY